jgi:hypothetical protein
MIHPRRRRLIDRFLAPAHHAQFGSRLDIRRTDQLALQQPFHRPGGRTAAELGRAEAFGDAFVEVIAGVGLLDQQTEHDLAG